MVKKTDKSETVEQMQTSVQELAVGKLQEADECNLEGAPTAAALAAAPLSVVLPDFAALSPEQRFAASKQLLFIAPDVPPVPPRPRRNFELRRFDELLERQLKQEREQEFSRPLQRAQSAREAEQPERVAGKALTAPDQDASPRARAHTEQRQSTQPQRVKGSTRLEAKKQRRRDSRDTLRRRTVVTESEFLARREAVDRQMVVSTKADRVQIGVLEDKILVEHYVARAAEASLIGNVYLGKVQNVLPSMEAAFVDIGEGRNAVLYSGEVDWSEYSGSAASRKIEKVLSPGDTVLVQVTKDPVGQKGARLTCQISLPGRFLVYVPGGSMNGISRKLPDTERARLKKILKRNVPESAGVIVRTAAEGASEDHIDRDIKHLTNLWEQISKKVAKGGSPKLLHAEPDMLIKIVRDVFNEDFQEMVVSGADSYKTIVTYLEHVAPDLLERIHSYEDERDIFDKYRVNEQIQKALDRKVWLPSGGSLVIDRTEAMTVIDVNTGKFVGSGGNLEETVTKNNLEAAEEIVRQLRLRDIGGIVVIDFIDMVLESNRDLVQRRLIECLGRDRTKHQVAEVTSLGLVQMTRKKLGLGLLESFSHVCEVCAGRGLVVQHNPVSQQKTEPAKRRRAKQEKSTQKVHAISDGAKNMIAKVAASTVAPAETPVVESEPEAPDVSAAVTQPVSAKSAENDSTQVSVSVSERESAPVKTRRRVGRAESVAQAQAAEVVAVLQAALSAAPADVSNVDVDTLPAVADAVSTTDDAPAVEPIAQSATRRMGRRRVVSQASGVAQSAEIEIPVVHEAAVSDDAVSDDAVSDDAANLARLRREDKFALLDALLPQTSVDDAEGARKPSRDGGAVELIRKHSDQANKLAGLFDVLGALPEPRRPGEGRGRAEIEERMKQRAAGARRVKRAESPTSEN